MDTGLVYRMVCPFTPQILLVLINRSWRDGMLSWRWYTHSICRWNSNPQPCDRKSDTVEYGH